MKRNIILPAAVTIVLAGAAFAVEPTLGAQLVPCVTGFDCVEIF